MLRGRSVSAGVPDAPGPSPWISQASRAGLRCCVVVVDVFGQLSAAMWQARLVGTPAWRFGPTHVCQGVGCRYCDVSVPGDGRGSRGRTLGRGIRPALNPLLNDGLGETPLAAGRRSGPHGRMRTIPGANDIYRDRTARSRSCGYGRRWPAGTYDICARSRLSHESRDRDLLAQEATRPPRSRSWLRPWVDLSNTAISATRGAGPPGGRERG